MRRRDYDLFVVGWNRYPKRQEHKNINNYKEAYLESIRMLQDIQPQTACLILGPTLQGSHAKSKRVLAELKRTEQLHREMANETGCAYFSLSEAMGGFEQIPQWEKEGWTLPGGKRLSESGYLRLAEELINDLFLLYDRERFERQRAQAPSNEGFFSRFAFVQNVIQLFQPQEALE